MAGAAIEDDFGRVRGEVCHGRVGFAPTRYKTPGIMASVDKALSSEHRRFVKSSSRSMNTASLCTESYDYSDGCCWNVRSLVRI
eukprot:7160898-Pyramimonas_sp.AAC.1